MPLHDFKHGFLVCPKSGWRELFNLSSYRYHKLPSALPFTLVGNGNENANGNGNANAKQHWQWFVFVSSSNIHHRVLKKLHWYRKALKNYLGFGSSSLFCRFLRVMSGLKCISIRAPPYRVNTQNPVLYR